MILVTDVAAPASGVIQVEDVCEKYLCQEPETKNESKRTIHDLQCMGFPIFWCIGVEHTVIEDDYTYAYSRNIYLSHKDIYVPTAQGHVVRIPNTRLTGNIFSCRAVMQFNTFEAYVLGFGAGRVLGGNLVQATPFVQPDHTANVIDRSTMDVYKIQISDTAKVLSGVMVGSAIEGIYHPGFVLFNPETAIDPLSALCF